jgi:phage terminase large subunit-like protein
MKKEDKSPFIAMYESYMSDVTKGKVDVCKWVKLAVERQKNDLAKSRGRNDAFPYKFDKGKGDKICKYISNLPQTAGRNAGKQLELQPWQCFNLCACYGWIHKQTGLRRFRRKYDKVPRKNGKSALISAQMLFFATHDDEGAPECVAGATTEKQAGIVMRMAKIMVAMTPDLQEARGVSITGNEIFVQHKYGRIYPVAGDATSLDGLNPSFVSVDEYHAHDNSELYDVLYTGMGQREQPMISVITTAGKSINGPCYDLEKYAESVLEGKITDDQFFCVMYGIDLGDDWKNPAVLRKANPNYGISATEDFLINAQQLAIKRPTTKNAFLTKNLNVWVTARSGWLPYERWKKCEDESLKIDDFKGKPCFIGLDLATRIDIAAKAYLFPDDEGGFAAFWKFYLPEAVINDRPFSDTQHFRAWREAGRLCETPGDVVDFETLEADLLQDDEDFQLVKVGYDPHQAEQLAQRLFAAGLPMLQVRQNTATVSPAMKMLEGLVYQTKIKHDGDIAMSWMLNNVTVSPNAKEEIYPRKEKPHLKIDGPVATIIALAASQSPDLNLKKKSIYEERGLVMF